MECHNVLNVAQMVKNGDVPWYKVNNHQTINVASYTPYITA